MKLQMAKTTKPAIKTITTATIGPGPPFNNGVSETRHRITAIRNWAAVRMFTTASRYFDLRTPCHSDIENTTNHVLKSAPNIKGPYTPRTVFEPHRLTSPFAPQCTGKRAGMASHLT